MQRAAVSILYVVIALNGLRLDKTPSRTEGNDAGMNVSSTCPSKF